MMLWNYLGLMWCKVIIVSGLVIYLICEGFGKICLRYDIFNLKLKNINFLYILNYCVEI